MSIASPLVACTGTVEVLAAKRCGDQAKASHTKAELRKFVRERPIKGVPEEQALSLMMATRFSSMAVDWASCMEAAGFRCAPLDLEDLKDLDSLVPAPEFCRGEGTEPRNPFYDKAKREQ